MGLFDSLFKKQDTIKVKEFFKMLDGYTPVYTNYNGGVYEMLQTKAIINTIATDCAKAIPQLATHNKKLEFMLQFRPNPFMTCSNFIERLVTSYLADNNAFIVPILDEYDRTVGLFPIQYTSASLKLYKNEPFIEYTFGTGQKGVIELSRVGHLKRMQYKSDIFGDTNGALNQTLELMHAQNESVTNALKQSGVIRFMGQIAEQLINKEAFEKERKLFKEVNFKNDNSQMMIFDSRYKEIKQVESKPIYLDEKQQMLIDENLKNYFGVSTNVIQHSFKDDYEWNSYYEGVIEPILIKIADVLTLMLYTDSQIMSGNRVYMTTNRLQYMSNTSKLNFSSQMFDRGIVSGNDIADVWQLPHYEGGEKHYIRKEYAEIQKLGEETVVETPIEENKEGEANEN